MEINAFRMKMHVFQCFRVLSFPLHPIPQKSPKPDPKLDQKQVRMHVYTKMTQNWNHRDSEVATRMSPEIHDFRTSIERGPQP